MGLTNLTVLMGEGGQQLGAVKETAEEIRKALESGKDWIVLTNSIGKPLHMHHRAYSMIVAINEVQVDAPQPAPGSNGRILPVSVVPADPFARQ